jgi:hypothetical protein
MKLAFKLQNFFIRRRNKALVLCQSSRFVFGRCRVRTSVATSDILIEAFGVCWLPTGKFCDNIAIRPRPLPCISAAIRHSSIIIQRSAVYILRARNKFTPVRVGILFAREITDKHVCASEVALHCTGWRRHAADSWYPHTTSASKLIFVSAAECLVAVWVFTWLQTR